MTEIRCTRTINIPDGFILFISGVPGSGKTTVSYELLKRYEGFRIIEETDIVRETLRGYNEYLEERFGSQIQFVLDEIHITDHMKLLTLDEAKQQCEFMKKSFEEIVSRQQRKRIPSIINGVHVIPEVLYGLANNNNIAFVNLFVHDPDVLYNRILHRNPTSYMLNEIPFIYQTNKDLYASTARVASKYPTVVTNIDVTNLNTDETIERIVEQISDN